ncbi:MAG: CPBP family intramembrane metalloprotease [Cytophagales bacterium]|nr:CPBP family intramembrane metalloprotease [Cytophagales bacterium]
MQNILANIPVNDQRSKTGLYLSLALFYIGVFVLLGVSVEGDANSIVNFDSTILMIVQGISSGIFFLLLPYLFWRYVLRLRFQDTFQPFDLITLGYTILLSISALIVISFIGVWNMSLDLPDSAFEQWAQAKEAELKILTEHLINFTSTWHFLLAILVIGVLPALGEELLFRGLIQNFISTLSKNYHIGIWISALLFSAIHLQFYGFFPRLILGALFGYIYVWSGRLSVAMLAHFLNNSIALTMAYVASSGWIDVSTDELEQSAPWPIVLFFLGFGAFALYKFKDHFHNEQLANGL